MLDLNRLLAFTGRRRQSRGPRVWSLWTLESLIPDSLECFKCTGRAEIRRSLRILVLGLKRLRNPVLCRAQAFALNFPTNLKFKTSLKLRESALFLSLWKVAQEISLTTRIELQCQQETSCLISSRRALASARQNILSLEHCITEDQGSHRIAFYSKTLKL